MRCLYCGKELALLKRLTGGAEFCSDAHRKRYQEDFNDLALSRLLQTQSVPVPLPLAPLEPAPQAVPPPLAAPAAIPLSAASAPVRTAPAPKKAAAPPVKPPEPQDPVVGISGYAVEIPRPSAAAPVVAGGEPPFPAAVTAALPSRGIVARAMARSGDLQLAQRLTPNVTLRPAQTPIRPRAAQLEIREFSRQAVAPAATLKQTLHTHESLLPGANGEAMEITNQPHPPADLPVLWLAGPRPTPEVNLLLGALARLDYTTTGFGEDLPSSRGAPPAPAAVPTASLAPPPPRVAPVPEPAAPPRSTKPLPITLHGSGAGPATPEPIAAQGVPARIEPELPPSSALPLRPTIVLAPRPAPAPVPAPQAAAPQSKPTPVVKTSAPTAPPAPAAAPDGSIVRPLRGATPVPKNRRPEVRVIQAGQPAAAPPAPPQVAPPAPTPAPVAKAPAKAAPPIAAKPEPVKTEVDLHLPELHSQEVQGPWARMPVALKAGIGAALALAIVGVFYNGLNSSKASAKPTKQEERATYNLGKQINSGGWIEDWAPADKERRITLLRGSQPYSDYRMEFEAQIQTKAIGWMYRGLNPKNYYVVKLEKLKPGLEPVVALVRYAVIDGQNEHRTETILPMKVRVDTTYKIRFDAVGNEFAVWVQDKKIDSWRDSRLGSGGLGLYSEGEEAAAVHGIVNVFELVSAK